MNIRDQNKLTKKQKETVAILSIGTLLEYFDLFIYVHLTVLINELFFPKIDPLTDKLLLTLTFCSTYIIRPIGGILIGIIGDNIGRKASIFLTTTLMSISCLIMANVPTYAEWGIIASVIVLVCRLLQGFSSMGEIVAANIYITEFLSYKHRYIACGIIGIFYQLGAFLALFIASISITYAFNWRIAFWVGSVIAFVGIFARLRLREAPDFIDHTKRIKQYNKFGTSFNLNYKKIVNKSLILVYCITQSIAPITIYSTFFYIPQRAKEILTISEEEIINYNLVVTIFTFIGVLLCSVYLPKKFHPAKITFFNCILSSIFIPFLPYWLDNVPNITSLILLQLIANSITFSLWAFNPILYQYFPINHRFKYIAILFGFINPIVFCSVSFGLIPLTNLFNSYALHFFYVPSFLMLMYSILYIRSLEIKNKTYYSYMNKKIGIQEFHNYNYSLGYEYIDNIKDKYSERLINILNSINKTSHSKIDIKLVEKAILFAKKWHGKQKRKTGEPFYSHPLEVARMVAEYKFKTHMVVAAILHDVVEDSDCTVELISKEFTPRIAEIVELLTREYNGKKLSIAETIKRIFGAEDYEALLIKGLDRLHNLQTIHGMKSKKQKEIAEETIHEIANVAAYAVDDLNINDKWKLERKLYKLSNKAFKKARTQS